MRLAKWLVVLVTTLLSLWAVAMQPIVVNELLPWVAGNGTVVWQEVRPLDLFQRIGVLQPWLPDNTFSVNIYPTLANFPISGTARPQIDFQGQWLVFHDANERVRLWDLVGNQEKQLVIGWQDTDNDGNREAPPNPTPPQGIFPTISGNGQFIAFLSRDPNLHDPDGDGISGNNNPPNPSSPPAFGLWFIYIHNRRDGQATGFDETRVGSTTTRFLPDPQNPSQPLEVRLSEVRLSLDSTGTSLAFTVFRGGRWELWFVADVRTPVPTLVAFSSSPFSNPSLAGSRLAFAASGLFQMANAPQPSPPGIYVVNMTTNQVLAIQTNGVNGAPMLSRDGNLLAFHSTMTAYRVNGGSWAPLPLKRNAVDDVFVFDLATGTLQWSTLVLRQGGLLPNFTPCINPALSSGALPRIAFQQIVNGRSEVRIVDTPATIVR